MSFLFLLVVAGLETTVQLVSHCVRMLMEQPHLVARLRENPSQVGRFVEEALRYEPRTAWCASPRRRRRSRVVIPRARAWR